MRSRLGVLVLVTTLVLLCAGAPAQAARQLQKHQAAAARSASPALAAQTSVPVPFPFGTLDAALLSLAGAPVIFLAVRRRQRAPEAVPASARRRSAR